MFNQFNPPLKTIVSFLKEISLDCFTLLLRWSFQNISPGQGRRASFIGGAGDGWGGFADIKQLYKNMWEGTGGLNMLKCLSYSSLFATLFFITKLGIPDSDQMRLNESTY